MWYEYYMHVLHEIYYSFLQCLFNKTEWQISQHDVSYRIFFSLGLKLNEIVVSFEASKGSPINNNRMTQTGNHYAINVAPYYYFQSLKFNFNLKNQGTGEYHKT